MEIFTNSAQATQKFGEKFASQLIGGEVIALVGGLGAGKTTFAQGLAKGLKIKAKIISPTFILLRTYSNPKGLNFCHIDLYRLEDNLEKEFKLLGIFNFLGQKEMVTVIEWADKAVDLLPNKTIWINLDMQAEKKRKITVKK